MSRAGAARAEREMMGEVAAVAVILRCEERLQASIAESWPELTHGHVDLGVFAHRRRHTWNERDLDCAGLRALGIVPKLGER